jgi:hypothetical protein
VALPVRRGNISNGQFAILGRVDHHRGCRWAQSRARLSHGWCDQPVPVDALEGGVGAGAGARRSGHCRSARVTRPPTGLIRHETNRGQKPAAQSAEVPAPCCLTERCSNLALACRSSRASTFLRHRLRHPWPPCFDSFDMLCAKRNPGKPPLRALRHVSSTLRHHLDIPFPQLRHTPRFS